jgi:hypothetical protein
MMKAVCFLVQTKGMGFPKNWQEDISIHKDLARKISGSRVVSDFKNPVMTSLSTTS